MASRRLRSTSSLTNNVVSTTEQVSKVRKTPVPRRIGQNVITANNIQSNAITTELVTDAAITNAKLAPDAVSTGTLQDSAVTTTKIVDAAVTTTKIVDSAVTTTKIVDAAVTTVKIVNAAVTTTKIVDAAVTTVKIVNAAVTTDKINTSAVTTTKIADANVTDAKIVTVSGSKISSGIDAANITTGTLPSARIGTGAINAAQIASVNASNVTSGTLSIARIADDSITNVKIAPNSLTAAEIAANAIGASELQNSGAFTMSSLTLTGTGAALDFTAGSLYINGALRYGFSGTVYPETGTTGPSANLYQAASDGAVTRTSSARKYKIFIEDFDAGLKALELRPRIWIDKGLYESNNNSASGLPYYCGFIAEELVDIGLEQFVLFNDNGEPENISYDRLTAAIIPVLKHQQAQIEALTARIEALENG